LLDSQQIGAIIEHPKLSSAEGPPADALFRICKQSTTRIKRPSSPHLSARRCSIAVSLESPELAGDEPPGRDLTGDAGTLDRTGELLFFKS
jgi:hypothetical protein